MARSPSGVCRFKPSLAMGSLSTGYQGSHGYKILARNYVNLIDPTTGLRPLPAFGQIDIKRTDGVTSFNGWQTSLRRRFHSGWLFSANYMWGHSLNDGAVGGGEADYPEIAECRRCDYSNSDQDIRHSFSANAVLPAANFCQLVVCVSLITEFGA